MSPLAAFIYGTLGGLLINVVRLAELASVPRIERPPTFSDPLWVFQFIALPVVGGVLAFAYHQDGAALKPLLAGAEKGSGVFSRPLTAQPVRVE